METQFAVREASPGTDQVAGALAAAHTRAAAGVSGFTVRVAFGREGGHGVVVRHVDFDHDIAPPAATAEAVRTAIGGYAATLAAAGFHLQYLTRPDGLRDGLLILGAGQ
jgi:hypothetical protein